MLILWVYRDDCDEAASSNALPALPRPCDGPGNVNGPWQTCQELGTTIDCPWCSHESDQAQLPELLRERLEAALSFACSLSEECPGCHATFRLFGSMAPA